MYFLNFFLLSHSFIHTEPGSPEFPMSSDMSSDMPDFSNIPTMQDCLFGDEDEEDDEPVSPLKEKSQPFERASPRRHSIGACQSQRRSLMRKSRSGSPAMVSCEFHISGDYFIYLFQMKDS